MDTQKPGKLTIIYYGADMSWEKLKVYGYRRRNTCLLKALVENEFVDRVIVMTATTRWSFWVKNLQFWKRDDNKVTDIYITSIFPGKRLFPFIDIVNRIILRMLLRFKAGRIDETRTITWSYWPDGYKMARYVGIKGRWIFDTDHNIVDDPNQEGEKEERETFLATCAKNADVVVSASRSMLRWLEKSGARRTFYLRNGINLDRFSDKAATPDELKRIRKPIIGYVGTLSRWVDFDLFEKVASSRPEWSFVIIGETYKLDIENSLFAMPNVIYLGAKPATEVPGYMSAFDVGLVLYRKDQSWLDVDSMKIFEYFAAGLPVVSTQFHPDLNIDFAGLLHLAGGANELIKALNITINENEHAKLVRNDLTTRMLLNNTWKVRAMEVIELMKS